MLFYPWSAALVIALGVGLFFRRSAALVLCGATAVSFGLMVLAHVVEKTAYPYGRTALPLVLLILLSLSMVTEAAPWMLRGAGAILLTVVAAAHLAALRSDYYAEWDFDADTKQIAMRLRNFQNGGAGRLCATWTLEPSLNYYRLRYALPFPPVVRNEWGPECRVAVLLPDDPQRAKAKGARLLEGKRSGAVLYDLNP
jgi:hypothetical protein